MLIPLKKHQDPFIEYAILESCLSCGILVWEQNFKTIQWIVNSVPIPVQAMACLRITSMWLLIKYWSGSLKYWFNYVSIN